MVLSFAMGTLRKLREIPERHIYPAQDGSWNITHGGGQVHPDTFKQMYEQGLIVKMWLDKPFEENGFRLNPRNALNTGDGENE